MSENKKSAGPLKKFFPYIIGILVIACISIGIYFLLQYRRSQEALKDPAVAARVETDETIKAVAKLMMLPADETPTVATVADITKLKQQQFFTNAANGDKVLIYNTARKAILYRPSIRKIIEIAPVNVAPATSSATASPSASTTKATTSQKPTFVLYNGTGVSGLTLKYEPQLKSKVPDAVIAEKSNAAKQDYTKTLIVDLSGTKGTQVQQYAGSLGISVSNLPAGETRPTGADFLIILGSDATSNAAIPTL